MIPLSPFSMTVAVVGAAFVSPAVNCNGQLYINLEVVNNHASAAISAFVVQVQDHVDGEFYDYLSGTDFDTATSNMLFATSTGPQEVLGAGGTAHAHIRVNAAYAIRFKITLTGSVSGNVIVRGSTMAF